MIRLENNNTRLEDCSHFIHEAFEDPDYYKPPCYHQCDYAPYDQHCRDSCDDSHACHDSHDDEWVDGDWDARS